MRTYLAAALAASLLVAGATTTMAAQSKKTATHAAADHMATGTVKSIDATKLVLKTKKGDMTFSLGSTKVENITTGATVQVHYTASGKDHVATSVMPAPMPAAKK